MTPREIWSNEAQERYVLAIAPGDLARFRAICERERCPFAVVGEANDSGQLVIADRHFDNVPVDVPLDVILGKPPRMHRDAVRRAPLAAPLDLAGVSVREAAYRVLRFPAVADKTFLVTIGDRTVGGLCARDPMVGPWQVPVADVGVTLRDFTGYEGEAMAIGERTPLALVDAEAAGRIAVGEAITNIAAAGVPALSDIKLSANWMAAAGEPGEDAALYDAVRAVALGFCIPLGLSIPVGKDSLSMRTTWRDADGAKSVTAPVSLIVSAFASIADARACLTPLLRMDHGATALVHLDIAAGAGASVRPRSRRCTVSSAPTRPMSRRPGWPRFFRSCNGCMLTPGFSPTTTSATAACSPRSWKWRSHRAAISMLRCPWPPMPRLPRFSPKSSAPSFRFAPPTWTTCSRRHAMPALPPPQSAPCRAAIVW
jgi:Phosphoribosylformylglycinamidine (FGAM) synthase, synthetase domain